MKPDPTVVADVIQGAARAIEAAGWCRTWRRGNASCTASAITDVCYSLGLPAEVATVAMAVVARHAGARSVPDWNDGQLTAAGVVAELDQCAAHVRTRQTEPPALDPKARKIKALADDARTGPGERTAALEALRRLAAGA